MNFLIMCKKGPKKRYQKKMPDSNEFIRNHMISIEFRLRIHSISFEIIRIRMNSFEFIRINVHVRDCNCMMRKYENN